MVFSSYLFLFFFLPFFLAVYYLAPLRWRNLVMLLCSLFFYGWANPAFVAVMVFSMVVDYCCGLTIRAARAPDGSFHQPKRAKAMVALSVVTNLGLLGFFKYFNFGVENISALMDVMGLQPFMSDAVLRVTLPLGISFYTFQSMSYTIDVYRNEAHAIRNPIDFGCYVAMFPQLVAGPIIRFHEIATQIHHRTHSWENFARGAAFFSLGFAKKILIANPMGKVADTAFDAVSRTTLDAWYGASAYAFQIYFDFSGYSDMAIGLGLMAGFVFPINFDSPYTSKSITEFWQRWHMSLSRWLRDYLYIPLGGNRISRVITYRNLVFVMLLGGLWHGASWNFVIWGALHGSVLIVERMMGRNALYARLPAPLSIAVTFVLTTLAWVFFRSATLPDALGYLGSLFAVQTPLDSASLLGGVIYSPAYVVAFAVAVGLTWGVRNSWWFLQTLTWAKAGWCFMLFLASIAVMLWQSYNPFIYFIF